MGSGFRPRVCMTSRVNTKHHNTNHKCDRDDLSPRSGTDAPLQHVYKLALDNPVCIIGILELDLGFCRNAPTPALITMMTVGSG